MGVLVAGLAQIGQIASDWRAIMAMSRRWAWGLLVLLCSCSDSTQAPAQRKRAEHESLVTFPLYQPGEAPWLKKCFAGGDSSTRIPVMGPARQYHGTWRRGFEISGFDEGSKSEVQAEATSTWLDVGTVKGIPTLGRSATLLYDVNFVGREPICDSSSTGSGFGHLNASQRLIVMERLISIRALAPQQ